MSSEPQLRVVVVDDHEVVHWGLRLMLSREAWVGSCFSAVHGDAGVELVKRHRPDVAVVDSVLAGCSGRELCAQIRAASARTRVLLFSGAGQISPQAARAAGASGFVPKTWRVKDIVVAIRMVGLGMTVFEPAPEEAIDALSRRERDVLTLIAMGSTNREIGERLHLSPYTVKQHSSSVYRKLGTRNRTEAVRQGQRLGLID